MDKPIELAFISDDNYAVNTTVAIVSLKHNRNKDLQYIVHLISNGISAEALCKIQSIECPGFVIDVIENSMDLKEFSRRDVYVSPVALTKFFLADILQDTEKVIYLDGDVIIQDALEDFYNIDLNGLYAAAVRDIIGEQVMTPDILTKLHSSLPYYFNSGAMLLNLKKLREEHIAEKLIEYKMNGINYFMDQDALNVIFNGRVCYLPCQYNYLTTLNENLNLIKEFPVGFGFDRDKTEQERLSEAHIIHMAGTEKAWDVQLPYITDVFMKYYRMSPFGKENIYKPQARKPENVQYLFPFELVDKGSRIVIWGAGKVGRSYYAQVKYTGYCNVVLWIDEAYQKLQPLGLPVASPEELTDAKADYVIIAVKNEKIAERIRALIADISGNVEKALWRHPLVPEY